MAEESIPLTTLSSANDDSEFLRVAFGFKNVPAYFSKLMWPILIVIFIEIF